VHDTSADQVDDVNAATGFDPVLLQIVAERPRKFPRFRSLERPMTGYVGPHTFYALPGRMLVGALSNTASMVLCLASAAAWQAPHVSKGRGSTRTVLPEAPRLRQTGEDLQPSARLDRRISQRSALAN
jgi:hypothetical protein